MSIEEILAYVQRTNMKDPGDMYVLYLSEAHPIYDLVKTDPFEAIEIAFAIGKAKGFRLARSQQRKGEKSQMKARAKPEKIGGKHP